MIWASNWTLYEICLYRDGAFPNMSFATTGEHWFEVNVTCNLCLSLQDRHRIGCQDRRLWTFPRHLPVRLLCHERLVQTNANQMDCSGESHLSDLHTQEWCCESSALNTCLSDATDIYSITECSPGVSLTVRSMTMGPCCFIQKAWTSECLENLFPLSKYSSNCFMEKRWKS